MPHTGCTILVSNSSISGQLVRSSNVSYALTENEIGVCIASGQHVDCHNDDSPSRSPLVVGERHAYEQLNLRHAPVRKAFFQNELSDSGHHWCPTTLNGGGASAKKSRISCDAE